MKLEEAKKLYPNEWIAFRIDEDGENPEGEVLLHGKNRDAFWEELRGLGEEVFKRDKVYAFFSGPIVPDGYTVVFRS